MYVRKTRDRWDISTNWGYGYEVEYSTYDRNDAKTQYREYRRNAMGRYDVILNKRREKI